MGMTPGLNTIQNTPRIPYNNYPQPALQPISVIHILITQFSAHIIDINLYRINFSIQRLDLCLQQQLSVAFIRPNKYRLKRTTAPNTG